MATRQLCVIVFVVISCIAIAQITCIAELREGKHTDVHKEATVKPEVGTKNVTARYCPHPCTVGNATICYPPPCPPPPCLDPAWRKPTDCCSYCPNGPDCPGPNGTIVKWNHWKIIDGKNCTCKYFTQPAICV